MRSRRNSSPISAPFRCEWRPSRWQATAMGVLGVAAAIALMSCALAWSWAIPTGITVLAHSLWSACKGLRQPPRQLLVGGMPASSTVSVDGQVLAGVELLQRGPLLMLRWRQAGRYDSLLFWPDTLSATQRRELRLAMRAHAVSRKEAMVAP